MALFKKLNKKYAFTMSHSETMEPVVEFKVNLLKLGIITLCIIIVLMILTAIVISLGVAAFVLALAYRSYRLQTDEDVDDDLEDESVALRAEIEETEPDDEPAKVDVGDTEGQLRT